MTETPSTFAPNDLDLNLDDVEREKSYKPFVFSLNGRKITLTDPAELDWQDIMEIDQPVKFLKYACDAETRDYMIAQKMPGWKFGKLVDAYLAHYGISTKGNVEGWLTS